ncbi:STAS domain-containing protein [Methylomonas rhizoryzae]|uniref:STAS domain-containing protein n=1 Tax=Methylomonas rhizoryzae TaxID=2608981 RepID=UPI001231CDDE|nr:STAS domain-containing protein [Methylomonas rhizoryzae]
MSEQNEHSLIGYDPLAWMKDAEQSKNHLIAENDAFVDSESILKTTKAETLASDSLITATELSEAECNANLPQNIPSENNIEITPNKNADTASTAQITLEKAPSIQNINLLHEQLLAALNKNNKIDIDASAVISIDTATLQLLLVAKRTALPLHKQISIDFPSDQFIAAAHLLGLAEILDVNHAAAGFF